MIIACCITSVLPGVSELSDAGLVEVVGLAVHTQSQIVVV